MYVQEEGVKDKNGGWGVIVSIFQQVGEVWMYIWTYKGDGPTQE